MEPALLANLASVPGLGQGEALMPLYDLATVLASVVGVNEALTLTGDALAAEDRGILLVPMYLYILSWFFLYCYPIARLTLHLERRFMVQL